MLFVRFDVGVVADEITFGITDMVGILELESIVIWDLLEPSGIDEIDNHNFIE